MSRSSGIVVSSSSLSFEPNVESVVQELRALHRCAGFDLALAVGKLILERIYEGDTEAWHTRGRKDISFKKLEQHPDLPLRASTLWKSVALYLIARRRVDLPPLRNLGPSHVHEVIGLEDSLQDRLLAKADAECWTVQHLRAEKRRLELDQPKHHGRPRLPAFVRLLRHLRNPIEERVLLTEIEGIRDLDPLETEQLLGSARRLCQQADAIARHLSAHLQTPARICATPTDRAVPRTSRVVARDVSMSKQVSEGS